MEIAVKCNNNSSNEIYKTSCTKQRSAAERTRGSFPCVYSKRTFCISISNKFLEESSEFTVLAGIEKRLPITVKELKQT
jgi:hypothetical protein